MKLANADRRPRSGASDGAMVQLACQEPSLSAEHIDEIIGHCPHARNFRKVAADQEPYVALGQAFSKRNLHKAPIIGRHVSREERDAVARACRGGLRRLAGGAT
jgi:hypothetical protein